MRTSAERIVEIQEALIAAKLSPVDRAFLVAEQRNLWDRDHAGRSYDDIALDTWRHRRTY